MKHLICALLACALLLAGCGSATSQPASVPESTPADSTDDTVSGPTQKPESTAAAEPETEGGKILVAYFSRTGENYNVGVIEKGNTAIVAEMIAEELGADLFEIRPNFAYPVDYEEMKVVAQQEVDDNARPELAETIDISEYDTIFVGYPIWWGGMPMILYTFLEGNDFTGKTVHPFNTHEGSGQAGTVQQVTYACPGAVIGGSIAVRGSDAQNAQEDTRQTVQEWLQSMGYVG